MKVKAVISVVGRDQKGVVARFATYVAEHGINIEDIEQQVVHGRFLMDMLVSLDEMTLSLDELIGGVRALGEDINMDVRVTLHNQKRDKKMAVLVVKPLVRAMAAVVKKRALVFKGEAIFHGRVKARSTKRNITALTTKLIRISGERWIRYSSCGCDRRLRVFGE